MGEVLMFAPRSHSKPAKTKPLKSDNLAYPSDKDMADAKAITDALALHHGLDVEVLPPADCEDDGA
jgi:hypothetical protein